MERQQERARTVAPVEDSGTDAGNASALLQQFGTAGFVRGGRYLLTSP